MKNPPPNQIVNLQNNFFLPQNLFFLLLKRIFFILAPRPYCASLFAQISRAENFAFLNIKVKFLCSHLGLPEQTSVTSLPNFDNLYYLLCGIPLSTYLHFEIIGNHDGKSVGLDPAMASWKGKYSLSLSENSNGLFFIENFKLKK